jgi:hypothetical protein
VLADRNRKRGCIKGWITHNTPAETLHVAVLHWPSRLNVDQLDFALLTPAQEMPRGQFRPVVTTNRFRVEKPLSPRSYWSTSNRLSTMNDLEPDRAGMRTAETVLKELHAPQFDHQNSPHRFVSRLGAVR